MKEKHSGKMLESKTMKEIERKQRKLREIDLGFGYQTQKVQTKSVLFVFLILREGLEKEWSSWIVKD